MKAYPMWIGRIALVLIFTGIARAQQADPADQLKEEIRRLEESEKSVQAEYDRAYARELSLQKELQDATSRVDVTHHSLADYTTNLERELDTLMLDHVGAEARIKSIEEAIAAQSNRAQKQTQSDEVARELQQVIDIRVKQFTRLQEMSKAAAVPNTTVDEAEANVAEARAKLAERRQTMFTTAGGELLTSLTHELAMLNIAERERDAKIQYIKSQLSKIGPSLVGSKEMEGLDEQASNIQSVLQGLHTQLRNYMLSLPPSSDSPQTRPSK